jgi:hypothetical protein
VLCSQDPEQVANYDAQPCNQPDLREKPRSPVISTLGVREKLMAGGNISCGSFQGEDKSGSAFEGVLNDITHLDGSLIEDIRSGLEEAEYVLISEQQAELLLPMLLKYRDQLISQIGHENWGREVQTEEEAGMDPVAGKWGESRGWRLYCANNLIKACQASADENESICVVFS